MLQRSNTMSALLEPVCPHYRRRCMLVAPCCDRAFPCRFCHDESDDAQTCGETLDRKAVAELVCTDCGLRQAVAETCAGCNVRFGAYACLECRFFDDDLEKNLYFHCDECGICRRGGRENWVHCDTCGTCLTADHAPCVERKLDVNCPVCFDRLFDSTQPVCVLHCGHPIHRECMAEMLRNPSGPVPRCPMCCRTLLPPGPDRDDLWARLRLALIETPMPPEATRPVVARCNDCGAKFDASFHAFELYECTGCGGFNVQR